VKCHPSDVERVCGEVDRLCEDDACEAAGAVVAFGQLLVYEHENPVEGQRGGRSLWSKSAVAHDRVSILAKHPRGTYNLSDTQPNVRQTYAGV
jgi:hypothetical protein